jgi:hypothetical protein
LKLGRSVHRCLNLQRYEIALPIYVFLLPPRR